MIEDLVSGSGLTLVLTINPFVSTDSANFKDGVRNRIFVLERNLNNPKNIPALTWFKVMYFNFDVPELNCYGALLFILFITFFI